MMSPTTFYMILAFTACEVISEVAMNIELKSLQNNADFIRTSTVLDHLAKPASLTALELMIETLMSANEQSNSSLDDFLQNLNWPHLLEALNHPSADVIWNSLQEFMIHKADVEDERGNSNLKELKAAGKQKTPLDLVVSRWSKAIIRNPREPTGEDNNSYQESLLNVTELAASHGYNAQEYTVQTDDGYILGLHRIWVGSPQRGKVPVLLMHGLLLSSACWLGAGPTSGLAYLLARAGYDVWLGNVRGSYYSRRHVSLDPDSSSYWQFSADEMGKYDLPAIIDKVLIETGADKLNYVGFSQGGGTYFIMCSELPHYCEKTNIMIAIAPSGRHLLTRSHVFRFMCEFCEKYEKSLLKAGIYEFLPKNGLVQRFFNFLCRRSDSSLVLCELIKDLIDGPHPGSFTKESILSMAADFPSGTSVHNMARFGQILKSETIHKFDYGSQKNLQLYGSSEPPLYNLSAVTVPVVVIYGRNDGIVDIDDVKWLIGQLPNVIEAFEVENPLWTHLDVPYSQHVPTLLYPKVKEYLDYTNEL